MRSPVLTRTVWMLSLISLFTDAASEMLYPVMPLFLQSIGFTVVWIGLLEGLAEATAGLSKGYFGKLSDVRGRRAVFVQAGYTLSALSKPLMAVWAYPVWIFVARTLDRLGKGVRTGARDALLSQEATAATKATVFGFHRSMDTLGAVIGPLLALGFLYAFPGDYVALFLLAAVPGILAVAIALLLKDKKPAPVPGPGRVAFFSFLSYWKKSPPNYRKLVSSLLFFALFNSSDLFLLMKAKEAGLSDQAMIGAYIFYNLVYALAAYPLGILADRIGLKAVFRLGLGLFAAAYFGMAAFSGGLLTLAGIFLFYGLYAAATEGVAKAWISQVSPASEAATALGTFSGLQSVASLLASTLAGLLWAGVGPGYVFVASGLVALWVAGRIGKGM